MTNCRDWQFVSVTKHDGAFEFRRTAIFALQAKKETTISDARRMVLSFLLQSGFSQATGLSVSALRSYCRTDRCRPAVVMALSDAWICRSPCL